MKKDIWDIICEEANKQEDLDRFEDPEQAIEYFKHHPTSKKSTPLLLDYDWVYDHAESLIHWKENYDHYQSDRAFYTLFKAITSKYPIEKDYDKSLLDSSVLMKWKSFAKHISRFFGHNAFENIRIYELQKVKDYFLSYPSIYNFEVLGYGVSGLKALMEDKRFFEIHTITIDDLKFLDKNLPDVTIPSRYLANKSFISSVSNTIDVENFYYNLYFISKHCSPIDFLETHKKYCDKIMSETNNNILLPLYEEYENAEDIVDEAVALSGIHSKFRKDATYDIYNRFRTNSIPKDIFYQELSKYYATWIFISRHFETSPYNLMIDIETLYNFAKENNRELTGNAIYEFLIYFKNFNLTGIKNIYERTKDIPLMEILYDDWNNQQEMLIQEINSKTINHPSNIEKVEVNGIECYDITNVDQPLITHNTHLSIGNYKKLLEQLRTTDRIKISLNVQDKDHTRWFDSIDSHNKTIKLVYGNLNPKQVGIVYHEDAYTDGRNKNDWKPFIPTRRLYTLSGLMEQTRTDDYNEVEYFLDNKHFMPIGILCENSISKSEQKLAQNLNIPIYFRKRTRHKKDVNHNKSLTKRYEMYPNKMHF